MKLRAWSRVTLGGALAAVLVLGCDGGSSGSFVVEIDDAGVSLADLRRELDARVEAEGAEHRSEILDEELERLVDEELALARARALGLEVDDKDVDEWLASLHGADYRTRDQSYRDSVREQLSRDRAAILDLAERLQVGDDAVMAHFEEHLDEFRTPARIQIRQILVQDVPRAQALIDQANSGADFAELARQHSIAPEASEGGLLQPFSKGEMPEVFDHAFALEIDETSEAFESPYGYHVFLLIRRFPQQEPELEDVRQRIITDLQTARLAELRRGWLRNLRKHARIRVNERKLETLR